MWVFSVTSVSSCSKSRLAGQTTCLQSCMRLLVTADLHYNHPKSKAVADDLIEQMNRAGGDVLLLVGDTAIAEGDSLDRCLERFRFNGPKLLVPGNHELWTAGGDSYEIFRTILP